ncbi:uncharacterized protein DEA37_0007776 [Paragonimus westermani]|uniref:Uncharacterized protein n=1 Tax=Paragonimus westermani TaxID=34504 RepID=A0A5J4NTI3_9TREM|nr:uncharacterized protein DEA37_0007776 [Paragonimus westermani]
MVSSLFGQNGPYSTLSPHCVSTAYEMPDTTMTPGNTVHHQVCTMPETLDRPQAAPPTYHPHLSAEEQNEIAGGTEHPEPDPIEFGSSVDKCLGSGQPASTQLVQPTEPSDANVDNQVDTAPSSNRQEVKSPQVHSFFIPFEQNQTTDKYKLNTFPRRRSSSSRKSVKRSNKLSTRNESNVESVQQVTSTTQPFTRSFETSGTAVISRPPTESSSDQPKTLVGKQKKKNNSPVVPTSCPSAVSSSDSPRQASKPHSTEENVVADTTGKVDERGEKRRAGKAKREAIFQVSSGSVKL